MTTSLPDIKEFRVEARTWLAANAKPRPDEVTGWGIGDDAIGMFVAPPPEDMPQLVRANKEWQATKYDAGWGVITWPVEFGGRALPAIYDIVFAEEESGFDVPRKTDTFVVTPNLIAPVVRQFGTDGQRAQYLVPFLRADLLACQLFSEPGAGSDLASVSTRVDRDGDGWVINGSKVWTSGADVADYGLALCRSDVDATKHQGITAFLVPLDTPGVDVRPIRQMSGDSSFNEVFLDGVRVSDDQRVGDVGAGWRVATATLAFERHFNPSAMMLAYFDRLRGIAVHVDRADDPVVRQTLADVYAGIMSLHYTGLRVRSALESGGVPGPEGSIGKLAWSILLRRIADAGAALLGPRMLASTGEWGTYAWNRLVLTVPGYRIAAGTDEIQRTILSEQGLGLPREPRPAAR